MILSTYQNSILMLTLPDYFPLICSLFLSEIFSRAILEIRNLSPSQGRSMMDTMKISASWSHSSSRSVSSRSIMASMSSSIRSRQRSSMNECNIWSIFLDSHALSSLILIRSKMEMMFARSRMEGSLSIWHPWYVKRLLWQLIRSREVLPRIILPTLLLYSVWACSSFSV